MTVTHEKPLVIYHGDCFDGFTAAWAWRYWHLPDRSQPFEVAEYIPAHHGDAPPDAAGRDVYVLDFAYPRATLERMAQEARSLLVLDHHKTAEQDLRGLPYCVFDMERSGAGLTWDHFATDGRIWLINLVEDRDLWQFRFGDATNYLAAYMGTLPMTFEAWDQLNDSGYEKARDEGQSIQAYIDAYGMKACAQAVWRRVGQHLVPVLNISYQNASEYLDRLHGLHPEAPFVASFYLGHDEHWHFSLRTRREDFDVSDVARVYGGGGHRAAAGFRVDEFPWIDNDPAGMTL